MLLLLLLMWVWKSRLLPCILHSRQSTEGRTCVTRRPLPRVADCSRPAQRFHSTHGPAALAEVLHRCCFKGVCRLRRQLVLKLLRLQAEHGEMASSEPLVDSWLGPQHGLGPLVVHLQQPQRRALQRTPTCSAAQVAAFGRLVSLVCHQTDSFATKSDGHTLCRCTFPTALLLLCYAACDAVCRVRITASCCLA